jgi:hypothetical protein
MMQHAQQCFRKERHADQNTTNATRVTGMDGKATLTVDLTRVLCSQNADGIRTYHDSAYAQYTCAMTFSV